VSDAGEIAVAWRCGNGLLSNQSVDRTAIHVALGAGSGAWQKAQ